MTFVVGPACTGPFHPPLSTRQRAGCVLFSRQVLPPILRGSQSGDRGRSSHGQVFCQRLWLDLKLPDGRKAKGGGLPIVGRSFPCVVWPCTAPAPKISDRAGAPP